MLVQYSKTFFWLPTLPFKAVFIIPIFEGSELRNQVADAFWEGFTTAHSSPIKYLRPQNLGTLGLLCSPR